MSREARHGYVLDPGYYVDSGGLVRCRFCFSDLAHTKTDCFTRRAATMAKTPKTKKSRFNGKPATRAKDGYPKPRSQDLPGLENRAIKPLEQIAAAYAQVRDQRMELNKEEASLKLQALKLMKKFDKVIYKHDGIEIRVVPGEETVKVKISKTDDEDADATVDEVAFAGDDEQPATEH